MTTLILNLFLFLGPLGNLLTPAFFPAPFRTYYFLLPTSLFFFRKFSERQLRLLLSFAPFFLYCFLSVLTVHFQGKPKESFPLERFFLFFFHFLFVIGIYPLLQDLKASLTLYLKGFFCSLFFGYFLYVGYYLNWVSFAQIEAHAILGQFGYGWLRFAPGSYANEYGLVSSFVLSVLTLALLLPEGEIVAFSRRNLLLLFPPTLGALLLSTTRAAYLSYAAFLLYLLWKGYLPRLTGWLKLGAFLSLLLFFLHALHLDLRALFSFKLDDGSIGSRIAYWKEAWRLFLESPFWGQGFATFTDMHNVYLQGALELGCIGIALFLFAWLGIVLSKKRGYTPPSPLISIALFHVFWFALTNHNLNHHLTWFAFLLVLSKQPVIERLQP